jgi:2-C-methyl-D-erythritol 4-phosphate cytidylyltransferase/2-C-methyl-D-erythritol 2,4-cyclodiphosphate synthase
MQVTAIIAAGGRGQRFGGERLKQLLPVGGRPILERSVAAFLSHPDVTEVIVALPQALADDPPDYLRGDAAARSGKTLRVVAGGERRQDSVANAFRAASAASDIIVIHDAARPFASADLIARTIAAAAEAGAALAAVQSRDTVKRANQGPAEAGHYATGAGAEAVSGSSRTGPDVRTVAETLPRETIFLAQTPQAFRRDVLTDALAQAHDATDEAMLAERAGHLVRIVDGEASNIKITTPEDMTMADSIANAIDQSKSAVRGPQSAIRQGPARTGRAGTGYDLHRLVAGRPLIIGGITIPSDVGALGHSDADVVCHAVTDAILGAVGLGDIGRHFPDSDPRWKGASSLDLLARAVALAREAGYEVGNVDVTVILERPKIKDYVDQMRAVVAAAIGLDPDRVSIKGKTNEGVDAVGRGEAIASHAVALLRSTVR